MTSGSRSQIPLTYSAPSRVAAIAAPARSTRALIVAGSPDGYYTAQAPGSDPTMTSYGTNHGS
jgi:hypothetical protein